MRRIVLTLTCLLCCLSLLAGCSLLNFMDRRTPADAGSDGAVSNTVPSMDPAEGPKWVEKIRQEMLSNGTVVEQAVSDTVTLEAGTVTDSSVEMTVQAPDIYDEMVDWYNATPEEERTEEAVNQRIEEALDEAEPQVEVVVLEIVVIDTEPCIRYTEEFLQWLSCGLRWFFQRFAISSAPGFCQDVEDLNLDFELLRQRILAEVLLCEYYDSLCWTRADVDLDGERELLLEMTDDSTGRPVQMLLDGDHLWSYTTTGAAQFTGFLQVEGRWAFENTYATAGAQIYDLYFWDGSQWESYASFHSEATMDAEGNVTPVVSVSQWAGKEVSEAEFNDLWAQRCTPPLYDSPSLGIQTVLGRWEELLSALDAWVCSEFTCLHFERVDFTGDGLEDCIFLLDGAADTILSDLTSENVFGGETFLTLFDDRYTVIAMEQTANGGKLTVSRILPSGSFDPNAMEQFHVDEQGGLCFGDASRYVYVPEYEGFAEDIDLSGMEAGWTLLDLLYLEAGELEGYLQGVEQVGEGIYSGLDVIVVQTVIVDGPCGLYIDENVHMGMTAGELWEGIANTDLPWKAIEEVQVGYVTSAYYSHPITGGRFRIDLYFDGLGENAALTRVYIMPWA